MLFDTQNIQTVALADNLFIQKKVTINVLRLDEIHPIVSGNKLFKLHYFLEEAEASAHKTILTFGGAWSNHLPATAYACHSAGLKSIGIVRGEEPAALSLSLQQCRQYGMQLKYVTREAYSGKDEAPLIQMLKAEFGECLVVPEGGYDPLGARGAALIMDLIKDRSYTHVCVATGTATTLAGLLMAAEKGQEIIAVNVLKGLTDIEDRVNYLSNGNINMDQLSIFNDHHFGGYAKHTPELIRFMNQCWQQFQLPLDFVYTAKMLYAVFDGIIKDRFREGSKICCLHTGGLAGNHSLTAGTLLY